MRTPIHILLLLLFNLPLGAKVAPKAILSITADSTSCDCGNAPQTASTAAISVPDSDATLAEKIALPTTGGQGLVALDLYIMSLCPYGLEALDALLPVAERFKDKVALSLYYIANENVPSTRTSDISPSVPNKPLNNQASTPPKTTSVRSGCAASVPSGEGPFSSLHGQAEIDESKRQLILREEYPASYYPYLECRSRQGPDSDWHRCAQVLGLIPDTLQYHALSNRATELFRRNIRRGNDLNINLSPTLFIDDTEFTGRFEPYALARHICGPTSTDPRCTALPICDMDQDCADRPGTIALCVDPTSPQARCTYHKPVAFDLHVVTTTSCERCNTDDFLGSTRDLFPAVRIRSHTLQTPQGQALAQGYGLETFPAYIFGTELAHSARFDRIKHLLLAHSKEDGFTLAAHLNSVSYWSKRPLKPGRLDVFLPTGLVPLEQTLLDLKPRSPGTIYLHYLPPSPQSLDVETQRRICLSSMQPQEYLDYLAQRLQTPEDHTFWQDQARQAGINPQTLANCTSTNTTQNLLAHTMALYDSLQLIPGSVAALMNNQTLIRNPQRKDFTDLWQEGSVP